jgi:hypothetical protein
MRTNISPCSCAIFASVGDMVNLRLLGYPVMASIFIDSSKASIKVIIHCCVNGIRVRGINHGIYHSV